MKKIKYILGSTILTLFLFGCDVQEASQDSAPIGSTDNYSIPSFTFTGGSLTTNEREEAVYTYDVTLDKPLTRSVALGFIVLEGTTATEHDDYDLVTGSVAAYETTTQLQVIIHSDDDITESTETLNLAVVPGPDLENAYALNPISVYPELNLMIENFLFCPWTLTMSDTYGDGWNGGMVVITSEDVTTEYMCVDLDGETVLLESQTIEVPIAEGADYSISYVSGGGTGGGPGWESENYYKLTAPDGTVWEGGTQDYSGIPTEGLITSGTNSCP